LAKVIATLVAIILCSSPLKRNELANEVREFQRLGGFENEVQKPLSEGFLRSMSMSAESVPAKIRNADVGCAGEHIYWQRVCCGWMKE